MALGALACIYVFFSWIKWMLGKLESNEENTYFFKKKILLNDFVENSKKPPRKILKYS